MILFYLFCIFLVVSFLNYFLWRHKSSLLCWWCTLSIGVLEIGGFVSCDTQHIVAWPEDTRHNCVFGSLHVSQVSNWCTYYYYRPRFQPSLTHLFPCSVFCSVPTASTVTFPWPTLQTSYETNAKFANNRTTLLESRETLHSHFSHIKFTVPCHGPPQPQILSTSICIGTTWGKNPPTLNNNNNNNVLWSHFISHSLFSSSPFCDSGSTTHWEQHELVWEKQRRPFCWWLPWPTLQAQP